MSRCRVLIVDDEATVRQGLTKFIARNAADWEVAGEARNGREALDQLHQCKPHLIISDIRMPLMDGIELARTVHDAQEEVGVVLLTGYKDFEYAQTALRYGVLDFLLKPCPEEELLRVLDKAYRKMKQAIGRTRIRNFRNEMMSKIMLGQADQIKEQLEGYTASMKTMPIEEAKLEASALAVALHEMVNQDFSLGDRTVNIGKELDRLFRMNSLHEVLDWSARQQDWFLRAFLKWMNEHNQNIVNKAIRYIEEHYMGECDLKEVADHVHLSPNYFSNMFKKETGESFVNYVVKIRMNKAKMLISNTELKVFEIAQKVGYDDPNYFTTVFKHLTDQSPSQYRKLIRKQQG